MKRFVGLVAALYLAAALLGRMRERLGLIACGCAAVDDARKRGRSDA